MRNKERIGRPWRERKGELAVTLLFLLLMLVLYSRFAAFVETRTGVVLDDPILQWIPTVDLTWPIFAIVYGGVLSGILTLVRYPDALLLAMRSYALLLLVRIGAMYVAPLAPPEGMILLSDPIAGVGPGGALTNDLFFSGHTATLFLFSLVSVSSFLRRTFLSLTVLLGGMLLLQHVHYTLDVIAAPFFAWGCVTLAGRFAYRPKI